MSNKNKKRSTLLSQKDFKDILEIPTNDNLLKLNSNNTEISPNHLRINQTNMSNNEFNVNNLNHYCPQQKTQTLTVYDYNDNERYVRDSNVAELASSEGIVEGEQQLRSVIEFELQFNLT